MSDASSGPPYAGVDADLLRLLEVVSEQLRRERARFAYLHGSRVTGSATARSDVDVAAWFGRPVDSWVVAGGLPEAVDLLVLDTAPLELAGRVALSGRLLLDHDPPARVAWEATTRKVYLDEQPRRDQARRDFARARRGGCAERLHRILRRITDDRAVLRTYTDVASAELLADPVRLGHIKYLFVTMLEGCIDAAHHVCAAEGYGPPGTNAEAVLLLARHGHLPTELAVALAQAVRFRNLLVHGYAAVDDGRVVEHLQRLGEVERYVAELTRLL